MIPVQDLIVAGVGAVMLLVCLVLLLMIFEPFQLWLQARLTGTPVTLGQVFVMRLRKVPARLIVHALIALRQRDEDVTVEMVEACYVVYGLGRTLTADELAELVLDKRDAQPG